MSASLYLFDEFNRVRIACAEDEPIVWIRTKDETVSLNFNRATRDALRAALDQADALDVEQAA